MAKVSIIIPVYNVEHYLPQTLDSVLQQSFADFEVLAVDDGSTDGSLSILRSYAQRDGRIGVLHQANQGQSAARNAALARATGQYVYFMDADDVLLPQALELCVGRMEETGADFVFFDADICYEPGAKPLAWNYQRTYLCSEHRLYGGEELFNLMLDHGKHNCVVWGLFVRRSHLSAIGLQFRPGIIHEDELFTALLLLQSQRVACLKATLVSHRVHPASTMGRHYSRRNVDCYLTVFDELLRFSDSPTTRKFASYTLSKVFYTARAIPYSQKPAVFWRAVRSGYLKHIGWKSCMVFWTIQHD